MAKPASGALNAPMHQARLPALTGLRGVAAIWVTAYHLLLPAGFLTGLPARLFERGYLAVDLFFALSGFVLARSFGGWFVGPGRLAALPGFLWRRWARIFPLYGLILAARLGYTCWRYGGFALRRPWLAAPVAHPWTAIPANLLLVQSWGVSPSVIGPAWSVSTEWAAYLAFPVLVMLILQARRCFAVAGVCAAVALLAGAAHHFCLDAWNGQTAGPLMRCLGGFTIGMACWRLSTWAPSHRIAGRPMAAWAVCLALVTGLLCRVPDLALYPLLPALILVLASRTGGPARLLSAGVPLWLGEISYALYLLHIFLLHPLDQARATARLVLPPGPADMLAACVILVLLLAAAELAHRAVERPARGWALLVAAWASGSRSSLTNPSPAPRNLPLPALRTASRASENDIFRTAR